VTRPAAHRPAAHRTPGARTLLASWRLAVGLFTVIPVAPAPRVSRAEAARAVLWLPAVGALAAVPATGVLLAAQVTSDSTARHLLAATLAIVVIALLTGGLHLDGLADTADGLGSRRPRQEALGIMRRSDIGPFGVIALVLVLMLQITALAALAPGWLAAAALVVAAVTGRVAVVLATGSPAARAEGFGALVAGATPRTVRTAAAAALLVVVAAAGAAAGGLVLAGRGLAAAAAGLLVAWLLAGAARRRLGGMTGDVFGALIEVATATVLVVLAVTAGA
jgi:adenosylcobinamide-GDP ribazoletransferase